jgi:hypothetical protein
MLPRPIHHSVISMNLGRPNIIRKHGVELPKPHPENDEDVSTIAFYTHAIKLYNILGEILTSVYEPLTDDSGLISFGSATLEWLKSAVCYNSIIELDTNMVQWQNNLPDFLLPEKTDSSNRVLFRQAVLLRARYLHLRMLLFRPFLSLLCQRAQALKESHMLHSVVFIRGSSSCIEAAQDMIQMIHTHNADGALPAWWYNVLRSLPSPLPGFHLVANPTRSVHSGHSAYSD